MGDPRRIGHGAGEASLEEARRAITEDRADLGVDRGRHAEDGEGPGDHGWIEGEAATLEALKEASEGGFELWTVFGHGLPNVRPIFADHGIDVI